MDPTQTHEHGNPAEMTVTRTSGQQIQAGTPELHLSREAETVRRIEQVPQRVHRLLQEEQYQQGERTVAGAAEAAQNLMLRDVRTYAVQKKESLSEKALNKRRKALKEKHDITGRMIYAIGAYEGDREVCPQVSPDETREDYERSSYEWTGERLSTDTVKVDITKAGDDSLAMSYEKKDETALTPEEDDQFKEYIIGRLDSFELNMTDYAGDSEFVSKYMVNRNKILEMKALRIFFEDSRNRSALEAYASNKGIKAERFIEEIKTKFSRLDREKAFFEAKTQIIKSPYYALLLHDDVGSLTPAELDGRIHTLREKDPPQEMLIEYLENLKKIAESGVTHVSGTVKSRTESGRIFGGRMTVTDVTRENVEDKAFNIDLLTGAKLTAGDAGSEEEYSRKGENKKEKSGKTTQKFSTQLLDGLEAGISGSYSYARKKRTITAKGEHSSFEAGYVKHGVAVSGSVGAAFFEDGKFRPQLKLGANASYAALTGNASASLRTGKKVMGVDVAEVKAKASAAVLQTKAKAKMALGWYKDKLGRNKFGLRLKGEAGAYAAKGSVSGSLSIMGVEAGIKAEGAVGLGAKFKLSHEVGGKLKCTIGLTVGVGGSVTFSIDCGKFTNAVKDKIKGFVRNRRGIREQNGEGIA